VLRTGFVDDRDSGRILDEILSIAEKHQGEGFRLRVAGGPAVVAFMNRMIMEDFDVMFFLASFSMLLILFLLFRHALGIVGPLIVVMQAALWTVGAMAVAQVPMTMVNAILPSFILCVAIGDSVHIQSVYRDARRRGMANRESIIFAVSTTGVPILFTSMTTAVGLLGFRFATLEAIRDMGTFGALGVFLAFALSMAFLPAFLTFNQKSLLGVRTSVDRVDLLDHVLAFCDRLSRSRLRDGRVSHGRRRVTLTASLFFTIAAVYGASTLQVFHDPLSWFPPGHEVTAAVHAVDEHVGGTSEMALLIRSKEGKDLKDRDLLLALEKLSEHVKAYRTPETGRAIVGSGTSILDVIKESWRAINGNSEEFYRIPDSQQGVVDMFTLFESSAPEELRRLATVDMERAVMSFRIQWMDSTAYQPLVEYIERSIGDIVGDRALVHVTGSAAQGAEVASSLLNDLMRSFSFAFVIITAMMILLLREFRLGVLAMIPNLLPIVAVMGCMGFGGIPLDINNILIASLAVGIAVDDTIHFLHQFRSHLRLNGNVDAAIEHAFSHTGRAMVSTSAILVAGFATNLWATLANFQRFGLLVALTVALALIVDLIFLPAMLRSIYGGVSNETSTTAA
jgi:predicted RND superfamily exporter protein